MKEPSGGMSEREIIANHQIELKYSDILFMARLSDYTLSKSWQTMI
jgi:hypothetical protein